MITDQRDALHALAHELGIQVRHHDIWGVEHIASDDTLLAIARALDVPVDRVTDAPTALATVRAGRAGRAGDVASERAEMQLPRPEPSWGVFVPVYALRREHDRGTGTLTDLGALAELIAAHGGRIVATLPILATWPEDSSPYAPVSRQAWDESVLDLDRLPGLEDRPDLRAMLPPQRRSDRSVGDRVAFTIDAAITAVAAAVADDARVRAAVDDLARRRADLVHYSTFRALADLHGHDWREWPPDARDAPVTGRATSAPPGAVFRYLYGQLAVEQQIEALGDRLRERGQRLVLDLPAGCDPHGFDTWWHRDDYAPAMSIGAPPDPFFRRGQNWGLPPLRPDRVLPVRSDSALLGALSHHLHHADAVRIDHIMGLHRLWWIPDGHDASDGAYVRYPYEALYEVVVGTALEHGATIVGEDLGTVEPEVRAEMSLRGMLGMWELQFEAGSGADGELTVPHWPVVVGCNTHDMATWHAFWTGADLEEDARLGRIEHLPTELDARREQVHDLAARLGRATGGPAPTESGAGLDAALTFLARSAAPVVLATLEDLWLESRAQNVPGTTDAQRENWRQRTALTLEELGTRDDVSRRFALLQAARS